MTIKHCVFAAIAAVSLLGMSACQREAEAPATPVVAPAATSTAPPDATKPAAAVVVEQPAMDFGYRCRQSEGAWSDAGQKCEITPILCPTFGKWVDGAGCKSDVAEADCNKEGQQFVAGQGCLIRAIPASAMLETDFKKG